MKSLSLSTSKAPYIFGLAILVLLIFWSGSMLFKGLTIEEAGGTFAYSIINSSIFTRESFFRIPVSFSFFVLFIYLFALLFKRLLLKTKNKYYELVADEFGVFYGGFWGKGKRVKWVDIGRIETHKFQNRTGYKVYYKDGSLAQNILFHFFNVSRREMNAVCNCYLKKFGMQIMDLGDKHGEYK